MTFRTLPEDNILTLIKRVFAKLNYFLDNFVFGTYCPGSHSRIYCPSSHRAVTQCVSPVNNPDGTQFGLSILCYPGLYGGKSVRWAYRISVQNKLKLNCSDRVVMVEYFNKQKFALFDGSVGA